MDPRFTRAILAAASLWCACDTFEGVRDASDAASDDAGVSREGGPDGRSEGGRSYACTERPARAFPSLEACRAEIASSVSVACEPFDAGVETGAPCERARVLCECRGGGSVEIGLLVRDCACR